MKILLIDNYDSFTYNLAQIVGSTGAEVNVRRNDEVTVAGALAMEPDGIILSPGPGRPENAGITLALIQAAAGRIPILGVCLGHQAIGMAFGGRVGYAPSLMHGRTSPIRHNGAPLYRNIADPFRATRYHSLIVEREGLPAELEVTAWTDGFTDDGTDGGTDDGRDDRADHGIIMGLRHRSLPIEGVQFHPESILTEAGEAILSNWLEGI